MARHTPSSESVVLFLTLGDAKIDGRVIGYVQRNGSSGPYLPALKNRKARLDPGIVLLIDVMLSITSHDCATSATQREKRLEMGGKTTWEGGCIGNPFPTLKGRDSACGRTDRGTSTGHTYVLCTVFVQRQGGWVTVELC